MKHPAMKFGELVRGTVTSFDEKGRGVMSIARPNGGSTSVAVPFAFIGDEIEAMIVRRTQGVHIADLKSVITPSPSRLSTSANPSLEHPGMVWHRFDYHAQLDAKRDMINHAFAEAKHEERIASVVPATETEHYRNRMDYVVGLHGEVGLKAYGRWNLVLDLTDDPLLSPSATAILKAARVFLKTFDVKPWDNRQFVGDLRYVVVREGKNTNDRLVIFVVHDAKRITQEMRDWLAKELMPHTTSLLIGEQPKTTDLSLAETFEVVFGNPWLEEEMNGIRYRISPNSFFQTNSTMAAKLQDTVLSYYGTPSNSSRKGAWPPRGFTPFARGRIENSPPYEGGARGGSGRSTVLDLYCGLGFFSIALAKRDPSVTIHGVEIDADAITLASQNAASNNVAAQCEFTAAKSEDLSWKHIAADAIILDPPRAGLHPRVIEAVLEMKPREIVYVSCNFHRLVEELKQFKTTYRIESLTALDLFPHTPHVEVIIKMSSS